MLALLVASLVAAQPAPPPGPLSPAAHFAGEGERALPISAEGSTAVPVEPLAGPPDVVSLCKRLVPAERLRPKGDAVEQGEAVARHEAGREGSMAARYRITVPTGRLAFAPYDGAEHRLEVSGAATLDLGGGVVVTAVEEGGLPVRVSAAVARRILAAKAAGRLGLQLVFDLPDDAVCGGDLRGKRYVLGVEPVEWSWKDGEAVLASGGVAGDRPSVNVAAGARPSVEVGDPIAGPAEARKAVAEHRDGLAACYADELRRAPTTDGVVVVDLGAKVAVAADSTGSSGLTACVEKVLSTLVGSVSASVPIRFELALEH